jgi:hypothetical protein
MYLVMGLIDHKILGRPIVRALAVLSVGVVTETLQYVDVPIFGRTFDPMDYLMFATSICIGFVFERLVLSRLPDGN